MLSPSVPPSIDLGPDLNLNPVDVDSEIQTLLFVLNTGGGGGGGGPGSRGAACAAFFILKHPFKGEIRQNYYGVPPYSEDA